ncbi:hypothetical protein [Allokutzneria sp. NRRL B-24872]|uniref:hypothetical protein n=1 Tax=Allokutzneria sp. NRRL B-24872 TaxID=1137961 RepID=UPI000A3D11DC|nr:hypothetical protein [Allokutzneria sp. NRRL B-24872]
MASAARGAARARGAAALADQLPLREPYRLHTFNIAHATPSAEVFLGEPTRHVSELATLR